MRRFIRWLLSERSNFFWTVAFLYSLSFFVVSAYLSFRATITSKAVFSAVFLSFVITTVLVVFRVVFDVIREHFKENMTLFEVVAFVEAKKRAEAENVRLKEIAEEEMRQKKLSAPRKFLNGIKEWFSVWKESRKLKKDAISAVSEVVSTIKSVDMKVDEVIDKVEGLESRVENIEKRVDKLEGSQVKLVVASSEESEESKESSTETSLVQIQQNNVVHKEEKEAEKTNRDAIKEEVEKEEEQINEQKEKKESEQIVEKQIEERNSEERNELIEEQKIEQTREEAAAVPEDSVPDEVKQAAENIRSIFSSFFGSRYPETLSVSVMSAKMLVDYLVSFYEKNWKVSSIGVAGIGNAVANSLAKIPLIIHTANVLSEAYKIVTDKSFGFTENLKLLLAALLHDVGKVPEVWRNFSNTFEIRKHSEYSANWTSNLLEERYSNLFTESWRKDLVELIYKHHSYYASSPLLDALKKADYLSRKKESGLTDSSIQEYYKFVGGAFSFDRERMKELVKDKFSVYIRKGFEEAGITFLYLPRKVSCFIGQKERDGKFYLFIDPEFLIGMLMTKLSFCENRSEWGNLVSFFSEYVDVLKAEKAKKIGRKEAMTLKKNFKLFLRESLQDFLDDDFPQGYSAPISFLDTSEFVNKLLSTGRRLPVKQGSDGFYRVRALIFSLEKLQAAGLIKVSDVVEQIPELEKQQEFYYFGSVKNDMNELIYGVPSLKYRSEV